MMAAHSMADPRAIRKRHAPFEAEHDRPAATPSGVSIQPG